MVREVVFSLLFIHALAAFSFADEPDLSVDKSLKLADQLEESGKGDEAKRIRDEARELAIKENLVQRKAAELEALQDELARLRRLTGEIETVKIRLLALSVDRTRLGDLAEEFDRLFPVLLKATPDESRTGAEVASGPPVPSFDLRTIQTDSPLFTQLKRRGAIQFLADPTLITTSHRPATFRSGGDVDDVPDWGKDGTRVMRKKLVGLQAEVLPSVQAGGIIRLRVKVQHSKLKWISPESDGSSVPIIDSTSTDTEVEVSSAQTIFLGGVSTSGESEWLPSPIVRTLSEVVQVINASEEGRKSRMLDPSVVLKKTHDSQTLFLISAELVDPALDQRQAAPMPGDDELSPFKRTVRNKLLDDLHYYPADPEFKRPR